MQCETNPMLFTFLLIIKLIMSNISSLNIERYRLLVRLIEKRLRYLQIYGFYNLKIKLQRSNRMLLFFEIGVLKSFRKFTEEHLCQSLSFNKAADAARVLTSFKPIWYEIKTWSYLELNYFQLMLQWEISKRCFQKQPSERFCKNRFS